MRIAESKNPPQGASKCQHVPADGISMPEVSFRTAHACFSISSAHRGDIASQMLHRCLDLVAGRSCTKSQHCRTEILSPLVAEQAHIRAVALLILTLALTLTVPLSPNYDPVVPRRCGP